MATDRLLRATVTGPLNELDAAICNLVLDRQFHPLQASRFFRGRTKLPDTSDDGRLALDSAVALMSKLGVEPAFAEFRDRGYTPEDCAGYVSRVSAEAARVLAQKNAKLSLAADDEALCAALKPYEQLPVDIGELLGATHMTVSFGSAPEEDWPDLAAEAEREDFIYLFRMGAEDGKVRCVYVTLPDDELRAAELMREYGFESEEPPKGAGLTGVPAQRIAELTKDAQAAREEAQKLSSATDGLREREREELLRRYSFLKYHSEMCALRSYASTDGRKFCLMGWVPEDDGEGFAAAAKALGCTCDYEEPGRHDAMDAPVKLSTGFFSRIFLPFVEMYGYPAYGEPNPSIFMLITYCLLFGVMFGDVGQGAVLILVGLYMFKKRGMWLGRILAAVGCSAVLFGFVYGSVFGNEHILPGFKVLEDSNSMAILLIAVGAGCVLILISGIFNIITGFRQRNYQKALFSANGVAGVLFFISMAGGAVCTLALDIPLLTSGAYWIYLGVLLLSIWFGEPLGGLLAGHKMHQGIGMMIGMGFFDLFEAVLSWLSNCLSFLRAGAYAIIHAIMMLVVYTLTGADSGSLSVGGVIGLIAGNAFVMVLETALVCIQVLRLEYYELFGRFYTGSGTPFKPVTIDYTNTASRAA